MEFDEKQIKELCEYSKQIGIKFFASVWDVDSAKLMAKHTRIMKAWKRFDHGCEIVSSYKRIV